MARQRVSDHGPARKYWTQVPNLVDDSDLDPYARALLLHYIRIAGQRDTCEETVRDSAGRCRMSPASVIKAREQLVDGGWIEIEDCGGHGRGALLRIHLLDRWGENMDRYSTGSGIVRVANNSAEEGEECSPGEQNVRHPDNSAGNVRVANKVLHHANNSNGAVFLNTEKQDERTGEESRVRARGPVQTIDSKCPMGPHTFTGSYQEHLESDPRHKIARPPPRRRNSASDDPDELRPVPAGGGPEENTS